MRGMQPEDLNVQSNGQSVSLDQVFELGDRIGSNSAFGSINPITNPSLRREDGTSKFVLKTIDNHFIINGVQTLPPDIEVAQYIYQVAANDPSPEARKVLEHINMPVSYKAYPDKVEILLPQADGDMNNYRSEQIPADSPSRLSKNDFSNCLETLTVVLDFFHKKGVFQNGMHPGNILRKSTQGKTEFFMADLGNCSIVDTSDPACLTYISTNKREFVGLIRELVLPSDRESGIDVTFEEFLGQEASELLDRYEDESEFRDQYTCSQFVREFLAEVKFLVG